MVAGTGVGRRLRMLAFALLVCATVFVVGASRAAAATYDTVGISASSNSVAMGGNLTYTVTIGPSSGTPAIMTDQVNGLTNLTVSPSSGSCSQSAGLVTCQTPLAQATTVTISGTVTAPAGTALHNVASVVSQAGQPVMSATAESDVQVTGGTIPPGPGSGTPDLVTSIIAPSSIPASGPITYTLVVGNQGTGNANNVSVVDTLPAGLTGASVTNATSLFACTPVTTSPPQITCSGGRIDAGAVATITITGTVPLIGPLVDQANVDPFDTTPESNYNNNTSQATTAVLAMAPAGNALGVSLSATPNPDVAQGSTLSYKTTITNNSTVSSISDVGFILPTQGIDPSSIGITFSLPSGQSQNVAQACGVSGAIAECFSADNDSNEVNLSPGQSMTITVSGTVIAPPAAKILGAVTVTSALGNPNANSLTTTATTTTQVKPSIDLSLTKASLSATVNAAAPLSYQYIVGNSGLNAATGVVVRDPLPAAMLPPTYHGAYTFAGTDSGFSCSVDSSNVLTCTGGTVPHQGISTINVQMAAPETTGTYSSVAQVDPNNTIPESDKSNNSATATTTVTTGVDLAIGQAVDNNPVVTAGSLTYTLTVQNLGTQDTTGVAVRDTLPSGTTFRSATGDHNFTCSAKDGVVTCVGGALNGTYTTGGPPDTATIKISVFAPSAPGGITNLARVNPDGTIPEYDGPNDTNDNSVLTTSVSNDTCPSGPSGCGNYIDLSIPSLTTQPTSGGSPVGSPGASVAPNGTYQYVMTVKNTGTQPAFQVELLNTLPAGARFISATGTGGFTCSASGLVIDCTGGEVDGGGGTQTITINAFAPADPGTYADQAIVDPHNQIPEANESNNSASVNTTVDGASTNGTWINLTLAATSGQAASPTDGTPTAYLLPNGQVQYTLQVGNTGQERATGVTVDDTLPSNVTFVSALDSTPTDGFSCTQAQSPPGTVHCVNGVIAAGGTDTIVITVAALNESGVSVGVNSAVVDPNETIPESSYTDNTWQSTPIPVQSNIDLTISQDGPGSASQNQSADYKLTVTNNNAIAGATTTPTARQVQVHDPLPPGLIVENITSDPNTFACQVSENPVNVVDCTGDLDSGQSVTIDVNVFVTAADSTTFTNEACVNPNHTILESDFTNNCSTKTTAVNTPDLSISESAATSPISPGQNEAYTIGVSNTGSGPVAGGGVVVTDNLPNGLKFLQASGTNGFTCTPPSAPPASQTFTCTNTNSFNPGDTTTIKVTAAVLSSPPSPAPFDNPVAVTGTGVSSDLDDNASQKVNLNGTGIDLVAQSLKANPDPVNPGGVLTYTGVVSNNGVQDSGNVTINQALPKLGATYVSGTGSNGFNCVYDSPSNSVNCSGDLPAGASTTIKIQLAVQPGAPVSLSSTINANPQPSSVAESDYTNNTKTVTSSVVAAPCSSPCVDLFTGNLVATPSPVPGNGTLTYNFPVGNTGANAADGVFIQLDTDTGSPAAGFSLTPSTANATGGFTCSQDPYAPNSIVCFNQDSTIGCTFTFLNPAPSPGAGTPDGSLNCASGHHSQIPGGGGVIVSVSGTAPPFSSSVPPINSLAQVFETSTDFNPSNNGAQSATTNVVAPGPAARGAAAAVAVKHPAAKPGSACKRVVTVSRAKSGKRGAKTKVKTKVVVTCGHASKKHKSPPKHKTVPRKARHAKQRRR